MINRGEMQCQNDLQDQKFLKVHNLMVIEIQIILGHQQGVITLKTQINCRLKQKVVMGPKWIKEVLPMKVKGIIKVKD